MGMATSTQKLTLSNRASIQRFDIAAIYLTVLTNCIVTTLIIIYILRERRALAGLQVRSLDLSLYTGVVALVIESALPLAVAGLIFAALYISPHNDRQLSVLKARYLFAFLFYASCVSLAFAVDQMCLTLGIPVPRTSHHYLPCYHRSILGQSISQREKRSRGSSFDLSQLCPLHG